MSMKITIRTTTYGTWLATLKTQNTDGQWTLDFADTTNTWVEAFEALYEVLDEAKQSLKAEGFTFTETRPHNPFQSEPE